MSIKFTNKPIIYKKEIINNNINNYDYDNKTITYYKNMRTLKLEVFTQNPISEHMAFHFPYMFNPLNGERLDKDSYGSLLFHPDHLIRYFYINRLKNLWNDGNNGFEGHYGDGLCAGINIKIIGRGEYPERYLFRLPIQDVYLPKNLAPSIVTMGPILTNNEIEEIDRIATQYGDHYEIMFKSPRPKLKHIKELYDKALTVTNEKLARLYVESLKNI